MDDEYAFRVTGRLAPALLSALDPLQASGTTVETLLVGRVPDQSALHGYIARIESLGLELVGLQRLPRRPAADDGPADAGRCPTCGEMTGNRACPSAT